MNIMTPAHSNQPKAKTETARKSQIDPVFLTFLACSLLLISQAAYAQNSPMADVLCSIMGMIYGNLGRGLSTLAVVVIGVGATLGKTTWGLAMTVAIGVAVIFNAGYIVTLLGMGGSGCA